MKLAKRLLSLAMVAVMLVSTCVFANAASATVTMTSTGSKTLSNSVKYTTYDMHGSVCGGDSNGYVLEFNPKNGAIPMAYSASGGANVSYFSSHIDAAKAQGYKVLGAINGSFFNMTTLSMGGILISGGRIVVSDSMVRGESVGIFGKNGEFKQSYSNISYSVLANGVTIQSGLSAINKDYDYVVNKKNVNKDGVFYYDDFGKSRISEDIAGYEVLCEKLDNTELAVNKTLKAKVVSVKESTFGASRPGNDDQFYLFIAKTSSEASKISSLKAGNSINITATETNTNSKEAMGNAYSVISSCYALVLNGVDQTESMSVIGTHSVTLERAWTAFGVKEDGSYVYFINEEKSNGLTLRDVAAAMIKLGCKNVYRLDGGGSSAMYNEKDGVVYTAESGKGRAICDVLLIVEKPADADTPDTPDTPVERDNLAYGKTYTMSLSNGSTSNTPAKDWNANLTDEIAFNKCNDDVWTNGGNSTWFGLHTTNITSDNYAYITLDLGAKYDISGVRIHCGNNEGWGICAPYELYVQYSADGREYASTRIGVSDDEAYWTGLDVSANARYIRLKVYLHGSWAFFNEIKVYAKGAKITEPVITYDDGTPDDPSDNPAKPEGPEKEYLLGDVNCDSFINADDYILLKRIFFGMAKLENQPNPETALARSDVSDNDGVITADDYILLKRVFFGMAKL